MLIFAPSGRDSAAARTILSRAGIETVICTSLPALCREVDAHAGMLLLGEEALSPPAIVALADVLSLQPSWSDLPILLLTGPGPDSATAAAAVSRLGNVTLLERPVREASLVSAVRAALRARGRQYELRDRLELQTLLAAIVESSDVAIVGKTTAGIIMTWNKAAEHLFGYTAKETVGQPVTMLIPPERHAEERDILARIVLGERVNNFETVRIRKDGRRFDALLTISPICDAAGRVIGASKVARDISTEKQAEFALREAARRKDEFLATLAHELRNPLAPIRSSITLLEQAGRSDPAVEQLRGILRRQVGHMVRLVDDLMEVSRITRGSIELRREPLDLSEVIRVALETSEPLLVAAGLSVRVDLPREPLLVDGDSVRLTQVVANLLNNAAKYSGHAGEVQLSARPEADDAVVSVRDQGVGIPRNMLEKVFEMFVQVPGPNRGGQGGLGIGLTLVRSLVEMHGGTVTAASPGPGQGTEFVIHLPLVEATARKANHSVSNGVRPLPARILVVDDNRDAADSMGLVLRRTGAEVEVAHDGEGALRLLERFQPALILLDIGMPGMDGYEVARRVRAMPAMQNVILVALTGWGQAEDQDRSLAAGFDHHLVKPAGIEELRALVPAAAQRRRPEFT